MTNRAAIFDLDGVVMDTESQYSKIWNEIGKRYLPHIDRFDMVIKGQTLRQIFDAHFAGDERLQAEIKTMLDDYERQMQYDYQPGVVDFIGRLRADGIKTALATSSNNLKMANVYAARPEFKSLFDFIVTADMFTRSKPDPECFLLGAEKVGASPNNSVVFEDSLHGLKAARAAHMTVVGVATTYPRKTIAPFSDIVIDTFENLQPSNVFRNI